MQILAIINKQANSANNLKLEDICAAATKFNLVCLCKFLEPEEIDNVLNQAIAQGVEVVLVGGGDGTVRAVAERLLGTQVVLGVLPVGTYNHFAVALKLPSDLADIFQLIHDRKIKEVDVAEVNSCIFLNNASIGLYAKIVKQREKYIDVFSKNKLWKIVLNILNVFYPFPVYEIEVEIDDKKTHYSSCLVFIGNNYYDLRENLGTRERLDSGKLCAYVLKSKTKIGILKMLLALLFKKRVLNNYLDLYTTQSLGIRSRVNKIEVALDGELKVLNSPLNFKIRKKALKIFAGESYEDDHSHL